MSSQFLNTHYLKPLLSYLRRQGHISQYMAAKIKSTHSFEADLNHEVRGDKGARSFCFVVIGERTINYASTIKSLPDRFIVGILLHEIAHMIIENEKGDPELGVDEWVIANVPESDYEYKNVRYIDFTQKPRTAKNLECVSEKFLMEIGV